MGDRTEITKEQATKFIEMLAHLRIRPGMYIGKLTYERFEMFVSGLETTCRALGVGHLIDNQGRVAERRGWVWDGSGAATSMRAAGLSEEEMILEAATILIETIQTNTGMDNTPVQRVHERFKDFAQRGHFPNILQTIANIEARTMSHSDPEGTEKHAED